MVKTVRPNQGEVVGKTPTKIPEDLHSLSALVHFMVLEKLDLISAEARGG